MTIPCEGQWTPWPADVLQRANGEAFLQCDELCVKYPRIAALIREHFAETDADVGGLIPLPTTEDIGGSSGLTGSRTKLGIVLRELLVTHRNVIDEALTYPLRCFDAMDDPAPYHDVNPSDAHEHAPSGSYFHGGRL